MENNTLTGTIPAAIKTLTNLYQFYLSDNQLTGSIPAEIKFLTRLGNLRLANNRLSGPIPPEIGTFHQMFAMMIQNNTGLNGRFTPSCNTPVFSSNTSVTICGCSSIKSPAFIFPNASTPAACLSTGTATPLSKRTQTFAQNLDGFRFTCNTDENRNPFQNCLNAMSYICNATYVKGNGTRIADCKKAVNTISDGLNNYWKDVRVKCGHWSYNNQKGDFSSPACADANVALRLNAFYILPDNTRSFVTFQLTESVRLGIWNNMDLRD